MTEPTPRPWREAIYGNGFLLDADGVPVAQCYGKNVGAAAALRTLLDERDRLLGERIAELRDMMIERDAARALLKECADWADRVTINPVNTAYWNSRGDLVRRIRAALEATP